MSVIMCTVIVLVVFFSCGWAASRGLLPSLRELAWNIPECILHVKTIEICLCLSKSLDKQGYRYLNKKKNKTPASPIPSALSF